jgi:hypothetical protein
MVPTMMITEVEVTISVVMTVVVISRTAMECLHCTMVMGG